MKKSDIAEKFYKGDRHPSAKTIGTLIKILQELPPDLKLESKVEVKVYNMKHPGSRIFCSVEECEQ